MDKKNTFEDLKVDPTKERPAFGQLRRGGNPLADNSNQPQSPTRQQQPAPQQQVPQKKQKAGVLHDSIIDSAKGGLMDKHALDEDLNWLHREIKKLVVSNGSRIMSLEEILQKVEEEKMLIAERSATVENTPFHSIVSEFIGKVKKSHGIDYEDFNDVFALGYTDSDGKVVAIPMVVGDEDTRKKAVSMLIYMDNGEVYRVYLQNKGKDIKTGDLFLVDENFKDKEKKPSDMLKDSINVQSYMDNAPLFSRDDLNWVASKKQEQDQQDPDEKKTAFQDQLNTKKIEQQNKFKSTGNSIVG